MKNMTCIVCPNGCTLTIEEGPEGIRVGGNQCKRGEEFARNELTHPMRTITTTVRTTFPDVPVLPVRVSAEIPKERIRDVMKEINQQVIQEPVSGGSVIIKDVLNLGVDVIVTSNLLKQILKNGDSYEQTV